MEVALREESYREIRERLWGRQPSRRPMPKIPAATELSYILGSVSRKHGFEGATLIAHVRTIAIDLARDEFCWRLYHEGRHADGTRYSYPDIGKLMDRHHTSVMMAVRRHEARRHAK